MSRPLIKWVRRLETERLAPGRLEMGGRRKQGSPMIFGEDDADAERQLVALRALGKYQDGDHVVHIRWMTESQAKARGWT